MKTRSFAFLASAVVLSSCNGAPDTTSSSSRCSDPSARAAATIVRNGAMILIPKGCRNFANPGSPPLQGTDYACTDEFWIDSVETSISAYQAVMGSGQAALHNPSKDPCPGCPIDNLTYFEAVLLANARTKAEMTPADTVYSYGAVVTSKTTNSLFKGIKPDEVTNLVGLVADTSRKGYRLPSRIEFAWAALQDQIDAFGQSDSVDALFQWAKKTSGGTTHPVGTLLHNGFGMHDWNGNVWEWTSTMDSVDVGWGSPVWEYLHVALGGDYQDVSSATTDYRAPLNVQDEQHAGARMVRKATATELSVGPRPCR